ncbi:SpaA isopeptide-forming pilin-related protein [Faecalibaculum rodentium]|uniref:SpaA isopeptide-forming pilin-related protein n=1 Tax=Faecalibaculum rodentium TaxID=1702221 RepID=UPI002578B154|nr:SpaA isopeptide-forming pilin-related protein [Faecalibaculum rodentium]
MRKGKLFSGKTWKRIVRILSCIVVFCTTYALILPAITQEAQAYCSTSEHKHTEQCYKEIESCGREEHQHGEDCYDADGSLICTLEEHTHSDECYRELLECTEEEHTHSLECFSDPEADKETEEDWKKTVPTGEELKDKTVREQIVMISQSQKGYKESDKNYQVENETEKKGITRYGQWDQDPYEDWTSAYVRFVLHHAGVDTADAKKPASDWLEQLHQAEALKNAEEAEPGDVLFVYDSSDHLKTGIVEEKMDSTIKALIGDWDNEVKEQSFNAADESVHSIWKPVATDQKPEEIPTGPDQPEEPKPEEEAKPEDKEEQPAEKSEEEPVVTYDFTQEVEAEDGAKIKVSWNAGTFETEDVVFQAKKVELTEEEQKKVQEQLDKDKNYTFRNYDLTFYVRDENMELQKAEPMQPVHVEIEHLNDKGKSFIFHIKNDASVEQITVTEKESQDGNAKVEFKSESFSPYVMVTEDGGEPVTYASGTEIDSLWKLNKEYHDNGQRNFYLKGNVGKDNDNGDWNTACYLNKGGNVTIDLNGFSWQTKGTIIVSNGTVLTITNSNTVSTNQANSISNNSKYDTNGSGGTTRIKFADKEGNLKMAVGGGIIISDGIALKVEGSNSKLVLNNGVGIISNGQEAIVGNNGSKTELYHSYICSSKVGVSVHFGAKLALKNGSVISLNSNPNGRGGGVYADDVNWGTDGGTNNNWYGSRVTMEEGSLVSSNTAQTGGGVCIGRVKAFENRHADAEGEQNYQRTCFFTMKGGVIAGNVSKSFEGAGLALQFESFSRAVIYEGEFYKNRAESGADWGGGGIFVSEYNYLWMPNGASIYENISDGLGGGLTGCATGKMIIDPSLRVFQNTAHGWDSGFPASTSKIKAYNYKNKIEGYWGEADGYKGEDIFGADKTQLSGQFQTADKSLINANWQGNVDKTFTVDNDGTTLNAIDWLTVKCMLPDSTTDPLKNLGVQIHGNTSKTHGAGVLINGWLVTGDVNTSYMGKSFGVEAFKKLIDETGTDMTLSPGQFHFKITEENNQNAPAIATGTNNEQGKITFQSKLPVGDDNRTTYIFYMMEDKSKLPAGYVGSDSVYQIETTVQEESRNSFMMYEWDPENDSYTAKQVTIITNQITAIRYKSLPDGDWISKSSNLDSVTIGNQNSPTFTNTLKDRTSIRVKKSWVDGSSNHQNDSVTVNLLQNDIVKESITLNVHNGWQYTWNNLPLFDGDVSYSYRVEEVTPEGYLSRIEQTGTIQAVGGIPTPAYVPASSISNGEEYYIIASGNNVGMGRDNRSIKGVNVADYKIEGYNAYSTDLSASGLSVVKADTNYVTHDGNNNNQKTVSALQFDTSSAHYLASDTQRPGIRILNQSDDPKYYDSQDPGFCICSSDLSLKTGQKETDTTSKKLVFYDNSFMTENHLPTSDNGGKVQLFVLGTINTGGTSSGIEYTITNTPISNSLSVKKIDDADQKPLAGAVFSLFTDENCTQILNVYGSEGIYAYSGTGMQTNRLVTKADGTFQMTGLPQGVYYLKEIQAPNGYEVILDENGRVPVHAIKFENSTNNQANISIETSVSNHLLTYELPETGSAGTKVYTATGTILLLTGTNLYRYKRRRNRKGGEAH